MSKKLQQYEVPFSVWELIKNMVPHEEMPLIRSAIGESLIETCLDLRAEVETLLQIWKEMNNGVDTTATIKIPANSKILSEPPQVKEMLKMEIKLLVKNLNNEKSSHNSLSESDIKTINYVVKNSTCERPSTPVRAVLDGNLASSSTTVRLKDVRRSINARDVDRVVKILQEAVSKECTALESDVVFLQECIEKEHNSHQNDLLSNSTGGSTLEHEPSLNQLKQARKNLENEILHSCKVNNSSRVLSAPALNRRKSKVSNMNEKYPYTDVCDRKKLRECWVEPPWTEAMSNHCSIEQNQRPSSSRNLNIITSRLETLKVGAIKEPSSSDVAKKETKSNIDSKITKKEKVVKSEKTLKSSVKLSQNKKLVPQKPLIRPPLITRRIPKTITPTLASAKT